MKSITTMKLIQMTLQIAFVRQTAGAVTVSTAFLFCLALSSMAQVAAPNAPKMFGTANEAAEAIIKAAESYDETAIREILGPDSYDIIHTGEPVADREAVIEFARLAREKMTLSSDKRNKRMMLLSIGADDWPCPIPIVKKGTKWSFDTVAGRQEILYRRVGRNELDAIKLCRGYVEAQGEYAEQKHDGAPVNQYAQRIIASPGKQDGLAWRNPDGTQGGPVGEGVAKAIEKGYTDRTAPYHGYFFRILKGQGPSAPLGKMDFVVNGYMIGGFALIAYPAGYGSTGVKTFMVSHDGVVYEKDFGMQTSALVKDIELFDPNKTWSPVFDDDE